jgi:hypothetical protein
MVFSHWRELLNGLAVSGAVRAGYALAISGYLEFCRHNGVSVSLESARGYEQLANAPGSQPGLTLESRLLGLRGMMAHGL